MVWPVATQYQVPASLRPPTQGFDENVKTKFASAKDKIIAGIKLFDEQ
jgi:hypothetical protein